MLNDEIQRKKSAIETLIQQYGARRIRVFGSVARGEEQADSDIDFLVDFPIGYDLFKQRIPLSEGLQKLFHRKIDLIPEHEVNTYIHDSIFSEAVDL